MEKNRITRRGQEDRARGSWKPIQHNVCDSRLHNWLHMAVQLAAQLAAKMAAHIWFAHEVRRLRR